MPGRTPQLYNLKKDIGETNNQAAEFPDKVKALEELFRKIKDKQ